MNLLDIHDPYAPPRPVGIDLGTTHSLIACMTNGRPEVITHCQEGPLLPSVVCYTDEKNVVVGQRAKALALSHPSTTFSSVKRLMGRGANDPETRLRAPYDFVEAGPDEPNVVRMRVGQRTVTPVEVSAEILRALKSRAQQGGKRVGGAVVTVPAYFDDAQRQATKDAAKLAGLSVLRLIHEPTAAALAYGLDSKRQGRFVVYDLGGGTFDVTLLTLEEGLFAVKATGGDGALGGDDMDHVLADAIFDQLGLPQTQAPAGVRAVLDAARAMKHLLTEQSSVEMPLQDLVRLGVVPEGASVQMSRDRFAELVRPLLERTGVVCRQVLRDAGCVPADLDGVILVGGATRVPAVKAYVEALFGKPPLADIDPDQVVALGAAIQADLLAGQGTHDVVLLDVLPLSLGVEVAGGVVDTLLPRNTTLPASARAVYTTQEDNQTGFVLHVVQGERERAADCRSLARFVLRGIPPLPAGVAQLELVFEVDENAMLQVRACELTTGIAQTVLVQPSYGLDEAAIETMLLDAFDHGEEDLTARQQAEAEVEAARLVAATEKALRGSHALLEEGEEARIQEALAAVKTAPPEGLRATLHALDKATHPFAVRRLNHVLAAGMSGQSVDTMAHKLATHRKEG